MAEDKNTLELISSITEFNELRSSMTCMSIWEMTN